MRVLRTSAFVLAFAGPLWALADVAKNPAERALLVSLETKKYIRARGEAERLLEQDPRSVVGRYGLARVYHREEANLPRALHQMQRALKELLKQYGSPPTTPDAKRWHRRVLLELETILGEMDRRVQQLAMLDRHDALYAPKQRRRRVWPLMKLHRFEEAEKIAKRATLSADVGERVAGYNGLLSIEFERRRPEACYRVAIGAVRATAYRSCILDLNTAEAAFAVFRFAEAEHLALQSIQAPIKDCPSSAHPHLANLYLLKGDFKRAIAAVRDARKTPVPRRYRQQFEMGITAWLTRLLMALGRFERSYELSTTVLRRPDRVGLISYSAELMRTIHTIDHYAALRARMEQQRERISARGMLTSLPEWTTLKGLQLRAWTVRRKIARLVAQEDVLPALVRPYLKPLPSWLLPLLPQIVGEGVVERAIGIAMAKETQKDKVRPYLAAVRGENAWRRGDCPTAERLAKETAKLPAAEVLLKERVRAWRAACALRRGDTKAATRHFDRVIHRWPTALRILNIPLPLRIESAKASLARSIAHRLIDSPRVTIGGQQLGFVLSVKGAPKGVRACLHNTKGRVYNCVDIKVDKQKDQDQQLIAAVDRIHSQLFSPLIDLTQQDINSLDGRAVRGRADEVLKEVLGL